MERGQQLAQELQSLFDLHIELPEACHQAESRIAEGISDVIQEATMTSTNEDFGSSIVHDGVAFEVRVREVAGDASALTIAIGEAAAHWRVSEFVQAPVKITGSGMYTLVTVEVDERLSGKLDRIAEILQQYLQAGYRRMETHVVAELLRVEHRLAIDLYAEVRAAFDESVASHIGLYCLVPSGQAMYLLDPLAVQVALSRLEEKRPTASASPLALATVLVKGWVKSEDTIAEKALTAAQPLRFRLQDLEYTTTPGFDVAEGGLYERTDLLCQPLVRDRTIRLIAAYPVELREAVEAGLNRSIPQFTEALSRHAAATKRRFKGTAKPGWWDADRFAELLGRFSGGFTDSLQ